LRESEEDEDEDDEDKENADSREKFMTEMAASLLEGYAFLFADPDTCKASEIYRSIFMLQMIATTHLNTVTGFIDVPELDTRALSSTRMECVIGACAVAVSLICKFEQLLMFTILLAARTCFEASRGKGEEEH
jgi:hypothetical protein